MLGTTMYWNLPLDARCAANMFCSRTEALLDISFIRLASGCNCQRRHFHGSKSPGGAPGDKSGLDLMLVSCISRFSLVNTLACTQTGQRQSMPIIALWLIFREWKPKPNGQGASKLRACTEGASQICRALQKLQYQRVGLANGRRQLSGQGGVTLAHTECHAFGLPCWRFTLLVLYFPAILVLPAFSSDLCVALPLQLYTVFSLDL